jgi:hypothetical protein
MRLQFTTPFDKFFEENFDGWSTFSAFENGNFDVESERTLLPDYVPGLREALVKAYRGHRRVLNIIITRRVGSEIRGYVMTWLKSEKAVFYDDFVAVLNKGNKIKRVKVGGRRYVRII